MEHEELTRVIIGCAIRVHRALGPGFLESVYRKALAHELSKACLEVHCEKRIEVRYDGAVVGDFFADMMIQNSVLIENKAVQALSKAREVQTRKLPRGHADRNRLALELPCAALAVQAQESCLSTEGRVDRMNMMDRMRDAEKQPSRRSISSSEHPVYPVHPVQCLLFGCCQLQQKTG